MPRCAVGGWVAVEPASGHEKSGHHSESKKGGFETRPSLRLAHVHAQSRSSAAQHSTAQAAQHRLSTARCTGGHCMCSQCSTVQHSSAAQYSTAVTTALALLEQCSAAHCHQCLPSTAQKRNVRSSALLWCKWCHHLPRFAASYLRPPAQDRNRWKSSRWCGSRRTDKEGSRVQWGACVLRMRFA